MSGISNQQKKQVPWTGRGPWGIVEQRTFGAAGAAAAAGAGFTMNAPKSLTLAALGPGATGHLPLPFLVAVPVAFFLMEIEPAAPHCGPCGAGHGRQGG